MTSRYKTRTCLCYRRKKSYVPAGMEGVRLRARVYGTEVLKTCLKVGKNSLQFHPVAARGCV